MTNSIDWTSIAITGIRFLANATSNVTNTSSAVVNFTLNNGTDGMTEDAISADDTSSSNLTTDFNNNTNGDDYFDDAPDNWGNGTNKGDGHDYGNGGWYLAIACVIVIIVCIFCSRFEDNNDVPDGLNDNAGRIRIRRPTMQARQVVENHSYAAQVRKMTPEERIALYNEAFDVNKNQVMLTSSHIIVEDHYHPSQQHDSDDDDDSVNSFDSTGDHSVHLSLDYARAQRRKSLLKQGSSRAINMIKGSKRAGLIKRGSIVHPRDLDDDDGVAIIAGSSADYRSNFNLNKSKRISMSMAGKAVPAQAVIRGECVICFDDMEVGDFIVWSESTACRHVFHKECMVAFLAHKRRMKKQTKMEAPCPTCRQHYVTVIEPPPPSPKEEEDGENNSSTATIPIGNSRDNNDDGDNNNNNNNNDLVDIVEDDVDNSNNNINNTVDIESNNNTN